MKISIVTPSLNQGQFIERTILSVLGQKGDFELDYIIVDGGSTDDSLDIIRRYEHRLRWISEKDRGQSDAINKGFEMASGNILGWLNSDDTYESNALREVAEQYRRYRFKWCFGNCRNIDENDGEIRRAITKYKVFESRRYSYKRLLSKDFISQPAAFFTRDVYQEVGPLDPNCVYSMDYDYWLRIGKRYSPHHIDAFIANFRWQSGSKNSGNFKKAAFETYLTARRHATSKDKLPISRHFVHYLSLRLLYKVL
ncbi:MAG: glycosyltransferase family 2 protein [Pseudomonadota bacterium]